MTLMVSNADERIIKLLDEAKAQYEVMDEKTYDLQDAPSIKAIREWERENPQEAEQIRREVLAEMGLLDESKN